MPSSRPTGIPSKLPTGSPSTEGAVYYPLIKSVSLSSKTATQIEITVSFRSATPELVGDGSIYCGAYTLAAVPDLIQVDDLKNLAKSGSVTYTMSPSTYTYEKKMNISSLSALTTYTVFCGIQATAPTSPDKTYEAGKTELETPPADVMLTAVEAKTACCKTVDFTNAPSTVYGDPTTYAETSSTSLYIFQYELSDYPDTDLTVKPYFTKKKFANDSTSTFVTASPIETTFKPSGILKGSFIITRDADATDYPNLYDSSGKAVVQDKVYYIHFTFEGSNKDDYNYEAHKFSAKASSDPLSAPVLESCIFDSGGSFVLCSFDSNTDLGLVTAPSFGCSLFFTSFTGYEKTTCSWVTSSSLKITFGIYSSTSTFLVPGETMSLAANKLRGACSKNCLDNFYNAATDVTAALPASPVSPAIVLSVPESLSSCDDLVIDASSTTGSGGRDWTSIVWGVTVTTGSFNTAELQAYLDSEKSTSISAPIHIPKSYLGPGITMAFSLTLSNFLGKSASKSSSVAISENPNIPVVSITGSKSLLMVRSGALSISSVATFSSCATEKNLAYEWIVMKTNASTTITVKDLTSTSVDSRRFALKPFALDLSTTYSFTVRAITKILDTATNIYYLDYNSSATATATVYVYSGAITAAISGSAVQRTAFDTALDLDAAATLDDDSPTNTHLNFTWSCLVVLPVSKYGSDCGAPQDNTPSYSIKKTIAADSMTVQNYEDGYAYQYTVVASSAGRTASSATVMVYPALAGSVAIEVKNSGAAKFNVDSKLEVLGSITATFSVNAKWRVYYDGELMNITSALTSLAKGFSPGSTEFPLAIDANTFVGSRTYTFELYGAPLKAADVSKASYGSISLTGNTAPENGYVQASPELGLALSTEFTVSAPLWTDDVSDYPLSYQFTYQLSAASQTLTIGSKSETAYVTSNLPAGLFSESYILSVVGYIYDIYSAVATASTTVAVTEDASTDLTSFLDTALENAINSGNTDLAFQTINNAASTLGIVNCTVAPNCTTLFRANCQNTPNTCGKCRSGYLGVVGDSNVPCKDPSSTRRRLLLADGRKLYTDGSVGSSCASGGDCIYGLCEDSYCVVPPLQCVTGVPDLVCSGNGRCKVTDIEGVEVYNRTIFDITCRAKCECYGDYGGSDCSLNRTTLLQRDLNRRTMCTNLVTTIKSADKSATLLQAVVGALYYSFNAYECIEYETKLQCSLVLEALAEMAAVPSYLKLLSTPQISYVMQTASAFLEMNMTNPNATAASSSSNSSAFASAIKNIGSGLASTLSAGQRPMDVVTDGVKISVHNDLLTDIYGTDLAVPASDAEAAYGVTQPKISLNKALGGCDFGSSGYAQFSVVGMNRNPNGEQNSSSKSLNSPLLTFAATSVSGSRRMLNAYENTEVTADERYNDSFAYALTFQFAQRKRFNYTALELARTDTLGLIQFDNSSLPECTFFDSERGSYVPCSGCNISSFTDYNVTYWCYDGSQLCSAGSGGRRLQNRRLAGDDDLSQQETETSASTYGALLAALAAELKNTLSFNPFAFDFSKAIPIVAFVASFAMTVMLGALYFIKWDTWERQKRVYLSEMKKKYLASAMSGHENPDPRMTAKLKKNGLATKASALAAAAYKGVGGSFDKLRRLAGDAKVPPTAQPAAQSAAAKSHGYIASMDDGALLRDGKEGSKEDASKIQHLLKELFSTVLPGEDLMSEPSAYRIFMSAVFRNHDLTSMFAGPSQVDTRAMRWLAVVRAVLVNMFVDTIFFGIFFPSDATCTLFFTKTDCLSIPSKWNPDLPMCAWAKAEADPDNPYSVRAGSCDLRPPPEDLGFTLNLALICLLVAIPLELTLALLMEMVCKLRPDLEAIGLNSVDILGTVYGEKPLVQREHRSNLSDMLLQVERDNLRERVLLESADQSGGQEELLQMKEFELAAEAIVHDFLTPEEEVSLILKTIREYLHSDAEPPWRQTATDKLRRSAKLNAIMESVGMLPDGQFAKLNILHYFLFGTQRRRFTSKITAARDRAEEIANMISEFDEVEVDAKEGSLIQHFILELVTPFKRYCLSRKFFRFDESSAGKVNAYLWLAGWAVVIGAYIFFFYWIFAWGIKNGGSTVELWGVNFVICFLQDMACFQIAKICILFVLAANSTLPQLRSIVRTLNNATMKFIQEGTDPSSDLRVCQYMSPSCRAARCDGVKHLAAAAILRNIDDYDVHNCRENRYYPLGWMAFFLICVPVLVAMLNEVAADISMDTLLPVILNYIILGFDTLYNAVDDPALVGVPVILFLAFTFYQYVLLPRSRRRIDSVARRTRVDGHSSILQRWKQSKRSRHTRLSQLQQAKSALSRCADLVATTLYQFSYSGAAALAVEAEQAQEWQWQMINLPSSMHGQVLQASDIALQQLMAEERRAAKEVSPGSSLLDRLPSAIQQLRPDEWEPVWEKKIKKIESKIARKIKKRASRRGSNLGAAEEEPPGGSHAEALRARSVTSKPADALRRALLHYLSARARDAPHTEEGAGEEEGIAFLVRSEGFDPSLFADEYLLILQYLWTIYFPGGFELTKAEEKDLSDLMLRWFYEQTTRDKSASGGAVRYSLFSTWLHTAKDTVIAVRKMSVLRQVDAHVTSARAELASGAGSSMVVDEFDFSERGGEAAEDEDDDDLDIDGFDSQAKSTSSVPNLNPDLASQEALLSSLYAAEDELRSSPAPGEEATRQSRPLPQLSDLVVGDGKTLGVEEDNIEDYLLAFLDS